MWFILLVAACVMSIPIAFEIHHKGSDNILVRTGKEILDAPLLKNFRGLFERLGASALTVIFLFTAWIIIVLAWKVVSGILGLLF
jgi:hypothetical protein